MKFNRKNIESLNSEWPLPKKKIDIVIIGTMAIVEACKISDQSGGTALPRY